MRRTIKVRIVHNSKDAAGIYRTTDSELHDSGAYITMPSSNPEGGARILLARSGDVETALNRARDMRWPFWIGGAGYSDRPRTVYLIQEDG